MRSLTVVALFPLNFVSLADRPEEARNEVAPRETCAQQYDIGDVADHSYGVAQGNCNAVSSQTGEKSGVVT